MVDLNDVLDNIVITDITCFNQEEFEKKIKRKMPDYEILVYDLDGIDVAIDICEAITQRVIGNYITDMQTGAWNTELVDLCMYVVAIKKISNI